MNKIQRFIALILIIGSFGNVVFVLYKKQKYIIELNSQKQHLKQQVDLFKSSLRLMFDFNFVSIPTYDNQFVIYFPSNACGICLEGLLNLIINDEYFEKIIVYLEDSNKIGIINQFNDSYGTNYPYIVGESLFNNIQNKISIFKLNNGNVTCGLVIDGKNKFEIKNQLEIFKNLQVFINE
jgi:hypothetical protein